MEKPSIFRETTSTTLLQVCFADSPVAGVLITVGVGLARWECAVGCLLGPFVALLTCFVSLQFLSLSVQSYAARHSQGFVNKNLGSSPGWWATTVVTYCPSRPGELPKFLLTKPCK